MFCVLGAPGSGKTIVAPILRELLPEHVVIDWDEFMGPAAELAGRPIPGSPQTWPAYTELVRTIVGASPERVVLLTPCTPEELQAWPVRSWLLLDCSDEVRAGRLAERGDPGLAPWANADALENRGFGLACVDSTGQSPTDVAAEIARHVIADSASRRNSPGEPAPPTVHVMCGLVGVGKTTVAKQLAEELPAIRLTRDEWMLRLVGGKFDDAGYVAALDACTDMLWDIAADAVRGGADVVLDWNHWNIERRREAAARAQELGASIVVHFVDVSLETAIERATARSDSKSHSLTAADVHHMATLLEEPEDSEGYAVRRH